jgi:hypothetical protein
MEPMEKEKIAETLTQIKLTIDNSTRDDLYSKTSIVSSILHRFYSKESAYQKDFKYIKQSLGMLVADNRDEAPFGPNVAKIRTLTHSLIDNILFEINQMGLPSKADKIMDKSINIQNHLSQKQDQTQTQTTNFSVVLETLKDTLTGKQYKEIVEIAEAEQDHEKAKPKIITKLLSFGENVCSNIIANLVTNPAIWTGLIP